MKKIFLITLCFGFVFSILRAETAQWKDKVLQLIQQPLEISLNSSSKKNTMVLVGMDEGNLLFSLGLGAGEGMLPIAGLEEVWITAKTPKDYNKALGAVGGDTFSDLDLDILRQGAYPMLRFVSLSEDKCSFRNSIQKLLEGQLQLGYLDEATFLLEQLDFEMFGPSLEELAMSLSGTLWEEERRDLSIRVMQSIPLEQINFSSLESVLSVAEVLRRQEYYEEVINIYSRLSKNESLENIEPILWLYYCELETGVYDNDTTFQEKVKLVETENRLYSLQQLVLGMYFMKIKQQKGAMQAVSEGVAYATPMDPWTPELMYRSAQLYEALDLSAIATAVYSETTLFFPHSRWSKLAQAKLNL